MNGKSNTKQADIDYRLSGTEKNDKEAFKQMDVILFCLK